MKTLQLTALLILSTNFLPSLLAAEFHADGRITGAGTVEYEVERSGAPSEPLKVQALVVGHGRGGSIEELLVSESFEVLPSAPSKTTLQVSEDNYQEWKKRFEKVTAALRVVPEPESKTEWNYKNLLEADVRKAASTGSFRVYGRWVAGGVGAGK